MDGVSYLEGDVSVVCWSSEHLPWAVVVGGLSLAVNVIGTPIFFARQIWKRKAQIQQKDSDSLMMLSFFVRGAFDD